MENKLVCRTCEMCSLAPCPRRVATYDNAGMMEGMGDRDDLHPCWYFVHTGFDSSGLLEPGPTAYFDAMEKFYKAEILRCVETGNPEAMSEYEQLLTKMQVHHKKIIEHTPDSDNQAAKKHQDALKKAFPEAPAMNISAQKI